MCNKIATEFVDGTKPKPLDKIKAIRPQIIVTGTVEKPYYEIMYYDTSDNVLHIGYSSYNLANVIKWKEECFEVVGEIEDMEVVKHGEWVKYSMGLYGSNHKCSKCGNLADEDNSGHYAILTNYCSNCGAKMDGGKDT